MSGSLSGCNAALLSERQSDGGAADKPASRCSIRGDAKPSIIIVQWRDESVVGDVVAAQNDDLMTKATNCTRLLVYHCQRDSAIIISLDVT